MTRSGNLSALVRRILVWHALGIGLGTLGFGLSYFVISLSSAPAEEPFFDAFFSAAYTAPIALIGLIRLTPVALALLALWTLSAWRFPVLESGPGLRGKALVLVTGCVLLVPMEIGLLSATGAHFQGTPHSGLELVGPILRQDGGATFIFLVTALGWFVGPRLLAPSLWPRFAGRPSGTAAGVSNRLNH
jgi:hypothetical protein